MAFIGKMVKEKTHKNPAVQVTFNPNINRISFIFRQNVIPAESVIDVLIGTEEDAGYIKIVKGQGTMVDTIGKKGVVTSWGASRSVAATVLPALRRETAVIIEDNEEYMLLQVPLAASYEEVPEASVAAELGL